MCVCESVCHCERACTQDLMDYLQRLQGKHSSILAFKPTGWTYSGKNAVDLTSIVPQCSGPITIYGTYVQKHNYVCCRALDDGLSSDKNWLIIFLMKM